MARELKVSDVARRHGVSRRTAYRWFVEIEKRFGPTVVGRRGRVLITTEDAFAAVVPLVAGKSEEERRVVELEERMADMEKRADKSAERVGALEREFQKAAARWFSRAS